MTIVFFMLLIKYIIINNCMKTSDKNSITTNNTKKISNKEDFVTNNSTKKN